MHERWTYKYASKKEMTIKLMTIDNESRKNLVQAGLEPTTYSDQILSLKSHDILMKSMVNPTESPKMKSIHKHLEFVTL